MKDSPFRSEKQKQAEGALYEAVGEFAVAFERIFGVLRMACVIMLERRGLTCQPLADVLLARRRDHELKELAGAMYAEFRPNDTAGQKELQSLLKKLEALTTDRNKYLHAVWTIGPPENDGTLDWSAFAVVLDKKPKAGRTVEYLAFQEFNHLAVEATKLQVLADPFCTCVNQQSLNLAKELTRAV